jgi:hypothetical protein
MHCTKTPVTLQNQNGVWLKLKPDDKNTLCDEWIPTEYLIKTDKNENGSIIYRVRTLYPFTLTCTDSYTPLKSDSINFSQYNFNFVIRFDSDTTGAVVISRGDSTVTLQLLKSKREAYWGGC